MFAKPMRLIAIGTTVFVALLIEAGVLEYLGLGSMAISWIGLGQAVIASSLTAAIDPTYREGYHFALGIGALAIWFFSWGLNPLRGIILGGACFAAMWLTYSVRRWRNSHRPIVDIGRYRRWRQGQRIPPL